MAQGMLTLPEGFSSWDEYDKFKKQTGPSMRPSYSNRFTEAVATNPLTGLLVPGAEQFLQRGGRPSLLDAGLAAADVALPAIPLAGIVKKFRGKKAGRGKGEGSGRDQPPTGEVAKFPEVDIHNPPAEPWSVEKRSMAKESGFPMLQDVGQFKHEGDIYVKVRDNRTGLIQYVRKDYWENPRRFDHVEDMPSLEMDARESWEDMIGEVLEKEYPASSDEWKDLIPWYRRINKETGVGNISRKSTRKELLREIADDSSVNLFDFGPYSGWISPKGKDDYYQKEVIEWLYELVAKHSKEL